MTHNLRIYVCFAMTIWLAGCSPMIPIDGVNGSGVINNTLTMDQVREAIIDGAQSAGWIAKEKGDGQIIATTRIRMHSVTVMIEFSEDVYDIRYKSSSEMKIQCTEKDHSSAKNIIVSGRQSCPGFADPKYIHGNYQKWITRLKASIDHSIEFAG